MPTKIEWQLPPGVTAGEIQWPLPEKLPPADVTTYGYNDEVVLLVPLKLATDLKPGTLDLKASVSWLECKEACIPGKANVEAALNIGSETKPSTNAAIIELWKKKIPLAEQLEELVHAWWENPADGDIRPLIIEHWYGRTVMWSAIKKVDFFPDNSDRFEIQATTESFMVGGVGIRMRKLVKKFSGDWPKEISGVIVITCGNLSTGEQVKLPVSDKAPTKAVTLTALPPQSPLWLMLLYAFIGGLILNIMPCVLPVIALKILGFVGEARSKPHRVRVLGGIYAVGVLFSFLVLAAIVIGVKAAGHRAGWGMQFGSPVFIVCLTTLVTLVALNLFGVFEVSLSGRAMNAADRLASKHGTTGAFFNGVLATVLATPCTAPFLSVALGFAFAQNASVILLIFLTVGLGLAAPYVLLSWNPAWLKFLPKPGAWMGRFRIIMGIGGMAVQSRRR